MISIITCIKNRTYVMYNDRIKTIYKNSLKSIMASYRYCNIKSKLELNLVDFDSSDTDYEWISNTYDNLNFNLIKVFEPINPGKGRNLGFKKSKGSIIMFLDADMLFPLDFFKIALEHIKNDFVYFPISFEETRLRWQFFADGNSVLTRKQVESIGRFQEKDTWGLEDNNFHKEAKKKFEVKHEILLGFIHQSHDKCWDKDTLKWNS